MRGVVEDVLGGEDAFPCWCAGVGGMALVALAAVVILGGYSALAPDSALSESGYRDRAELYEAAGSLAGRAAALPAVVWGVANAGGSPTPGPVGLELVRAFGGFRLPPRPPAVLPGEARRRARPAESEAALRRGRPLKAMFLPCPRCGDKEARISLALDQLHDEDSQFTCGECDAEFGRAELEALFEAWVPVMAWMDQAPGQGGGP